MKHLLAIPFLLLSLVGTAQHKQVAITMDDVPFNAMPGYYSVRQVQEASHQLLGKIKTGNTPVSIFINGQGSVSPDKATERLGLLQQWVEDPLITLGNHTLHHLNCAEIPLEQFKEEVMINDYIIRTVAKDKPIKYFRFPFNAIGKDSTEQAARLSYLEQKGYTSVPFTVESSDYMYAALYTEALRKNDPAKAKDIAATYIRYTLQSFVYFEKLTQEVFGRPIPQVYLCHANQLHADYYDVLIKALQQAGYSFISLEDALKDKAYATPVYYHQQYGFSWLFRWMPDEQKRKNYLRTSPDPDMK